MKEQSVLKGHSSLEEFIMAEFECDMGHLEVLQQAMLVLFSFGYELGRRVEELEVQEERGHGLHVLEFFRKYRQ